MSSQVWSVHEVVYLETWLQTSAQQRTINKTPLNVSPQKAQDAQHEDVDACWIDCIGTLLASPPRPPALRLLLA